MVRIYQKPSPFHRLGKNTITIPSPQKIDHCSSPQCADVSAVCSKLKVIFWFQEVGRGRPFDIGHWQLRVHCWSKGVGVSDGEGRFLAAFNLLPTRRRLQQRLQWASHRRIWIGSRISGCFRRIWTPRISSGISGHTPTTSGHLQATFVRGPIWQNKRGWYLVSLRAINKSCLDVS